MIEVNNMNIDLTYRTPIHFKLNTYHQSRSIFHKPLYEYCIGMVL